MIDLILGYLSAPVKAAARSLSARLDESEMRLLRGSHDSAPPHRVSSGFNRGYSIKADKIFEVQPNKRYQSEQRISSHSPIGLSAFQRNSSSYLSSELSQHVVRDISPFPSVSPTPVIQVTENLPLPSKHILNAQVSIRSPCCKIHLDPLTKLIRLTPDMIRSKMVRLCRMSRRARNTPPAAEF